MANVKKNLFLILLILAVISCEDKMPTTSGSQNGNNSQPVGTSFNLSTSVLPEEGGTVSPSEGVFNDGDEVEITARSNEDWRFTGWEGDHDGNDNPATFIIDSDMEITALFTEREYSLNIEIQGNGAVVEELQEESSGDDSNVVQLTAGPNRGWRFSQWEGDLEGDENPTMIEVNEEKNVTAIFESDKTYWHIPREEIIDVVGKDGIPSIDNPKFTSAFNVNFIPDVRMVAGVLVDGQIYAYPHQILDHHEIVNQEFGNNRNFSLLYCPLTGTATAWSDRVKDSNKRVGDFGVSGLLFRNNLIAYDRETDSYWSQMQLRGVKGEFGGVDIETYQVIETTWETWKKLYPESRVLTRDTGFNRNYDLYVYGADYSTNHNIILFPKTNNDDRLENKVRVHGIIDSKTADMRAVAKVFVLDSFDNEMTLIKDRIGNNEYLIAGSSKLNLATSFRLEEGKGANLLFSPAQNQLPVIMTDNEGNRWNIFGFAVQGPRQGQRLIPARSYTGYWFGWADFFPGVDIWGNP